jgi:histidine triad (HIT) family protein
MDDPLYSEFFVFAKRIAKAIKAVVPCTKVGIAVIGLEVAHAHIHLVPINSVYDIDFSKPKLKLSPEKLNMVAASIAAEVK